MLKMIKESVSKADLWIWLVTIWFFLWSSLLMWWNHLNSVSWALWIIVLMFWVWLSIELILSALRWVKWLWEITWFITNWPEALVLIVWLLSWNIIFAASTPLWSNVMNPMLLLLAFLVVWTQAFKLFKEFKYKVFYILWFLITAWLASSFFLFPENFYTAWFVVSMIWSIILYIMNKKIMKKEEVEWEEEEKREPMYYLAIWVVLLLVCWYFLDPVVNYTAESSMAPKWLIWFLVLSTLTSWPEFKSCVSLLKKWKTLDAFINILISNFANIWLASIWLIVFWLTK